MRRFYDKRSDSNQIQDEAERKQRPGETLDDYITALRRLVASVALRVDQDWMIKTAERNSVEPFKQWVYPIRAYTLEHLYKECKESESAFDSEYGSRHTRVSVMQRPRLEGRIRRVDGIWTY